MAADPEEPDGEEKRHRRRKGKGILWNRVRNRVREDDLTQAPIGESVEVITKEIDQVLADRRKRLNVKLKTSLKRFRTEVSLAGRRP
jgi:predicted site-specific integrase-resolvase